MSPRRRSIRSMAGAPAGPWAPASSAWCMAIGQRAWNIVTPISGAQVRPIPTRRYWSISARSTTTSSRSTPFAQACRIDSVHTERRPRSRAYHRQSRCDARAPQNALQGACGAHWHHGTKCLPVEIRQGQRRAFRHARGDLPRARLPARRHSGIPKGGNGLGFPMSLRIASLRIAPLRIAVGGFLHESATFIDTPTTWDDFARTGAWPGACEGEAMLETLKGLNLATSWFVDGVREAGHTVIPIAWTMAQPAGAVTAQAFERMSATLVDGFRRSGADVIFIELHGAMVADRYDDAEGELLRRIRAVVGPNVPVVGTLDLHVNMSDAMLAQANLLSAYRTYPHVDWGETGARVARWLDRALSWGPKPAKAMRRMPFLIPVTAGCSMIAPAMELYTELEAIEEETGVHLNFTPGFPPADIADCGPAVFGYGADQASVDRAVDRLADA